MSYLGIGSGLTRGKDFVNYKDEALAIYPTLCTPVQLYFDVIMVILVV